MRIAEARWHTIHPHESLVQERGARPGEHATRPVDPHQVGGGVAGQQSRSPDGTGARKKTAPKPSANPAAGGPPRIWLPRMLERHDVCALARPGPRRSCAWGRKLREGLGDGPRARATKPANWRWTTHQWCRRSWEYDREMYKRRNEVERLFRRLKGYRRIDSISHRLHPLRAHVRRAEVVLAGPSRTSFTSRRTPCDSLPS